MSDYLDPNNEELLKDFFSEAQTQVETLEQYILVLESDGANRDAVDEIFRAAHTLKGGSATVAMTELSHFTHIVEDVLDEIRAGRLVVNEEVVDILLQALDVIKAMLGCRMEGEVYQDDVSAIEAALTALLPKKSGAKKAKSTSSAAGSGLPSQAAPAPAASQPSPALSDAEQDEFLEAAGGLPVYKITVRFDENALMNTVGGVQVYVVLKGLGMILKTTPDFDALYGDNFFPVVDYYIATEESPEKLRKYVILPDVSLDASVTLLEKNEEDGADAEQAAPEAAPHEEADAGSLAVQREAAASDGAAPPPTAAQTSEAKKAGKEAGSILRVDSRRIDDLLNLVSETVIIKATFNQVSGEFGDMFNDLRILQARHRDHVKALFDRLPDFVAEVQQGRSVKDIRKAIGEEYRGIATMFVDFDARIKTNITKFRATAQNLGRVTGELQEGVMKIRMVQISQIFSRFPRIVRDLSKNLGKKVNLLIEGEETELDKSVVEDLLDPIMHSVRNSVDHGIESPEERKKAGKSEEGTVLLKASNEGNMIIIEIADDGKGIDVEAVKAKAIEHGLIHPNKLLSDSEAYNLIFEPGFSTAKTITNISGRGVGLDVVRRQIEKLNGTVTVSSERGQGSKFTIKLPLTLAIIQGLLVRVGTEIYSIPITSVIESVRIRSDEIQRIDNYEVFNIRNEVISLLRLNQLFGIKTDESREYHFVVIVGAAEQKMGFMVDSLIGEEDVVIKPLRDQYTASPGIAGASILGDGSVSLILDVSQLLELGLHREKEQRRIRELAIA